MVIKNSKGFSLLEILIVTGIMAVIALMASTAIKNGLQNKKKMDARLQIESMVFDALRLISTDIERAFHYQYALYEIDRQSLMGSQPPGGPGTPPGAPQIPQQNGAMLQPPERLTQFIGKDGQLHFTTINHQRTTANSQESNLIEVGYYVNDCRSRLTDKQTQCLWRRTSIVLDNDVTRGGESTMLLDNVTQFKLEYLSEDINDKEWKTTWITDNNGTATTQNMFPQLVKITLEIHDKDSKEIGKFKQTIIAAVRFTNNIDPAKKFAPSGGAPATPPGGRQ